MCRKPSIKLDTMVKTLRGVADEYAPGSTRHNFLTACAGALQSAVSNRQATLAYLDRLIEKLEIILK